MRTKKKAKRKRDGGDEVSGVRETVSSVCVSVSVGTVPATLRSEARLSRVVDCL